MAHTIGIWGDSILKGLVLQPGRNRYTLLKDEDAVSIVEQELKLSVQNHCRIGINSEKGLALLDQYIGHYQAGDIALLCFGGNDSDFAWKEIAEHPEKEHLSQVTPEHYKANIIAMIKKVKEAGMVPLLTALPPIDSQRYFDWISRGVEKKDQIMAWLGDVERIFRYHSQYNEILKNTAQEMQVGFLNIRRAFFEGGDFRPYLCVDGIHPNARGHRRIAKTLLGYAKSPAAKSLLFSDRH